MKGAKTAEKTKPKEYKKINVTLGTDQKPVTTGIIEPLKFLERR